MTDILQAARSYYGLADTDVRKTDIYTNDANQVMLVFELALSAEDFIAIGARMKNMQEEEVVKPEPVFGEGPNTHAIRQQYNAMSMEERAKYGSFGRYVTAFSDVEEKSVRGIAHLMASKNAYLMEGMKDRQVAHVDAPEEPEPVSMDAVWLDAKDCSQAQMMHASDADLRSGRHLVQWAMLTDEQKQKAKESGK